MKPEKKLTNVFATVTDMRLKEGRCQVDFTVEDSGEVRQFEVPQMTFNALRKGYGGTLSYRKDEFKGFA